MVSRQRRTIHRLLPLLPSCSCFCRCRCRCFCFCLFGCHPVGICFCLCLCLCLCLCHCSLLIAHCSLLIAHCSERSEPTRQKISTKIFQKPGTFSEPKNQPPTNHTNHTFYRLLTTKNHQVPPIFRKTPPKNHLKKITGSTCNPHTKKTDTAPEPHAHKPPKPPPCPQTHSPA